MSCATDSRTSGKPRRRAFRLESPDTKRTNRNLHDAKNMKSDNTMPQWGIEPQSSSERNPTPTWRGRTPCATEAMIKHGLRVFHQKGTVPPPLGEEAGSVCHDGESNPGVLRNDTLLAKFRGCAPLRHRGDAHKGVSINTRHTRHGLKALAGQLNYPATKKKRRRKRGLFHLVPEGQGETVGLDGESNPRSSMKKYK